jgi:hypothetical protein
MTGHQVYSNVAGNTVRNAVFFGLAAVILRWLAGSLFGKIGMWIFVGTVALDVLHTFVGVGAGIAVVGMKLRAKAVGGEEKWLAAAQAVRLLDAGIAVALAWWVMRANDFFGGAPGVAQ